MIKNMRLIIFFDMLLLLLLLLLLKIKHLTMVNKTLLENFRLTAENFATRLAQANLANKSYISNFVKKKDFDDQLKILNKKMLQIKRSMCLSKIN